MKVPFKDVICEVNLVVENEKLILSEASRKAATDFVDNFCEKQSKKAQEYFSKANKSKEAASSTNDSIDGKVTLVCEPKVNTTGNRRSTRKRKVIITDD